MRVLIVVANPETIGLSMGIKIQHHLHSGDEVILHSLSVGHDNSTSSICSREEEVQHIMNLLAVDEFSFSYLPRESFFEVRQEVARELDKYVSLYAPDLLYTHFPKDLYYDHVVVAQECLVAAKEVPSIIYFKSLSTRDFRPNHIALGTPLQLQKKIDVMRWCYLNHGLCETLDDLPTHSASLLFEYLPHHLLYKRQQEGRDYFGELFCIERQVSLS